MLLNLIFCFVVFINFIFLIFCFLYCIFNIHNINFYKVIILFFKLLPILLFSFLISLISYICSILFATTIYVYDLIIFKEIFFNLHEVLIPIGDVMRLYIATSLFKNTILIFIFAYIIEYFISDTSQILDYYYRKSIKFEFYAKQFKKNYKIYVLKQLIIDSIKIFKNLIFENVMYIISESFIFSKIIKINIIYLLSEFFDNFEKNKFDEIFALLLFQIFIVFLFQFLNAKSNTYLNNQK